MSLPLPSFVTGFRLFFCGGRFACFFLPLTFYKTASIKFNQPKIIMRSQQDQLIYDTELENRFMSLEKRIAALEGEDPKPLDIGYLETLAQTEVGEHGTTIEGFQQTEQPSVAELEREATDPLRVTESNLPKQTKTSKKK
jgi:hypothetical protein